MLAQFGAFYCVPTVGGGGSLNPFFVLDAARHGNQTSLVLCSYLAPMVAWLAAMRELFRG